MRFLLAAVLMSVGGPVLAGPALLVPITSGDQLGIAVRGKAKASGGVAALVGMWSDDGALELGGFHDRSRKVDPGVGRAAEIMSGRGMRSQGVRLTGSLYRAQGADRRGWTLSVDVRRQQVSDLGAALSGSWRTVGDSRLTLGGKLAF